MTHISISWIATLMVSLLLDGAVRPRARGLRQWQGVVLHLLVITAGFGVFLAGAGHAPVAAVLMIALLALLALASNAKFKVLGEPGVFSDLAMVVAMARHPRFYFTAIPVRQRVLLGIGAAVALVALVLEISLNLSAHLAGVVIALLAMGALWLLLRGPLAGLMREPDLEDDLRRYGLVATLLVYWVRWRDMPDPPPCPPLPASLDPLAPEMIVIVQCESFADPIDLTGDTRLALPHLAAARAAAWQWGDLAVSGFGAYTMRTEYGVLFGRSEAALGFRRYDPFMSAQGESTYALSARLGGIGYTSAFVHPHDLRFYARDRLMPAIGFDAVIGEDAFAAVPPGGGRYVDDRTLGRVLADRIGAATAPTLLYSVTMENHGPWDDGLPTYLDHARSSDAMLGDLIERLAAGGRRALLVFFGDHRPSIPGVSTPGGARHTPYVMMRFDVGGVPVAGAGRVDLSPADLHHAILRCVR